MSNLSDSLHKLASAQLSMLKQSFIPAQALGQQAGAPADGGAGMMPPGAAGADPAAAGAPPMDPAAMGGAPMDPAAGAGAMPPEAANDPALAAVLEQAAASGGGGANNPADGSAPQGQATMDPAAMPPPPPAAPEQDMKSTIRQVLEETGVIKAPKMKPDQQFQYVIDCMNAMANAMGVRLPPPPAAPQPGEGSKPAAAKPAASGGATKTASVDSMTTIINKFRN